MNEDKQEWFIAERARALAMVHLTRRDDLAILKPVQGVGFEFIVSITRAKGEPSLRQFGVFLRGTMGPVTETDLDNVLRPAMESFVPIGPFPYPVCLFAFSMNGDNGYYTWVAEPAVAEDGPRLLMHQAPHFRNLDRAALDEIVAKVNRWYDDFFGRNAVKAS